MNSGPSKDVGRPAYVAYTANTCSISGGVLDGAGLPTSIDSLVLEDELNTKPHVMNFSRPNGFSRNRGLNFYPKSIKIMGLLNPKPL